MTGPCAELESGLFKCFTVKGRATRAEYWWHVLIPFLVGCASLAFDLYTVVNAATLNLNPFAC